MHTTGNSMIDGHLEYPVRVCKNCNNTGKVYATRKQFNDYVMRNAFVFANDRDRHKAAKRIWRETGNIDCPECGG